jgi:hypothetical protein
MGKLEKKQVPLNVIQFSPIRVEGEFIGLPFHLISTRGKAKKSDRILINSSDDKGNHIFWHVTPNSEYGPPGELAYKLDKLLIDKRIDEAGPIKPKLISLGSLRGICIELGIQPTGPNINLVKKALKQNASAFVEVKKTIKQKDGSEKFFEGSFTRYSVIFTGEELPLQGLPKADQVYISLHDLYLMYLNQVGTRPLNYEYLKVLPPSSQRFYELTAPKIFACLKYRHAFARYSYGEFCQMAPLKKNTELRQIKKQITHLLKPHKESGYIESVDFRETFRSQDGEKDWEMLIYPGPAARREYEAFTGDRTRLSSQLLLIEEDGTKDAQIVVKKFWKGKGVSNPKGISKRDIELAQELLETFGKEKLDYCVEFICRQDMAPKFFSGIISHLPKAIDSFEKSEKVNRSKVKRATVLEEKTSPHRETEIDLERVSAMAEKLGLKWRPEMDK